MTIESLKSKYLFLLLIYICYLFFALTYFDWIVDDLYIYFRYASNFANGKGIVFNDGDHVEGISGLLWMFVLSLYSYSGLSPEFSAKLTGLLSVIFQIFIIFRICLKFKFDLNAFGTCALMLFNLPFIIWSVSGFEIMLYMSIQILIFYLILNSDTIKINPFILSLLIFLVTISRPEGILFSVCYLFFVFTVSGDKSYTLKVSSVYFITLSGLLLFRYFYFGDLLPNTYYAKIGHSIFGSYELKSYKNGLFYLKDFFLHNIQFIPLIILIPVSFKFLKKNKFFIFTLTVVLLQFGFVIFAGGDWMVQYRFIVPAIPYLSVLTFVCLRYLKEKYNFNRYSTALTSVFFIILMTISYISEDKSVIKKETVMWNRLKEITPELKKIIPSGSVVANGSSGIIPFYLDDVRFIDLVGLTDRHIAKNGYRHGSWFEKSLPEYVYALNPDWIVMWKKKDSNGVFTFKDASPCYNDMAMDPEFQKYVIVNSYDLYEDVIIELYRIKQLSN